MQNVRKFEKRPFAAANNMMLNCKRLAKFFYPIDNKMKQNVSFGQQNHFLVYSIEEFLLERRNFHFLVYSKKEKFRQSFAFSTNKTSK